MGDQDRLHISLIEQRLGEPTAAGLALAVSAAVHDGMLPAGTCLPPIRTMARELALSPTTVSASWAELMRGGVVRTDGRRGTFVLNPQVRPATRYRSAVSKQPKLPIDLSAGVPDMNLLPGLGASLSRLTSAGTPANYLDPPVLPDLRRRLLADWPFPVSDVLMTDGAMDAVDLLVATFTPPARVVVEHPVFPPMVDLLEYVGLTVVPVPLDGEGLDLRGLAEALTSPVLAVFLQPRAQNPTGVSMSTARAEQLAELLTGSSALIVEDDATGCVSTTEPVSLGRWLPDRVVHIRSFTKSHGPDLRLAAVSAPPSVQAAMNARRSLGQGWSSRLLQNVLLSMLEDPDAVRQVAQARTVYAERREALVAGLAEAGIDVAGDDGLNIWVPVRDESAAMISLAGDGIGVAPGDPFIMRSNYPDHIRVTAGLVHSRDAAAVATAIAVAAHSPPPCARGSWPASDQRLSAGG